MRPSSGQSDRAAWLKGPQFSCSSKPTTQNHPWRLVLLGPPGVGKGTQAELLCAHLGVCHLSTGDVFRTARQLDLCQTSIAMREALSLMQRGKLVPDELVTAMVGERANCLHCGGGFILDGFPRTLQQALDFDQLLAAEKLTLDAVIDYELSVDATIARAAGRLTCPHCHAVFHSENKPPRQPGICDDCRTSLKQREDDRPEVAKIRMNQYAAATKPLTRYYDQKGILIPISADAAPAEIFHQTLRALTNLRLLRSPVGLR
jgi:adenylate kinase